MKVYFVPRIGTLFIMFNFEQLQVVSDECLLYAFWPSLFFSSAVGVLLICIQFIGPLVILIYCYGRIIWVLTRRMDVNIGNNEINQAVDTFQTARSNTIKTFLLIAVCFIICWSNNQVYYLMYTLGFNADWNGIYYKFTVLMLFLNCTVNPFIYLFKYQDYQKALKSCFCFTRHENRNKSGITSISSTVVTNEGDI